jgi:tRNA nucleotidyltransferase (CCA-adding enzyme)
VALGGRNIEITTFRADGGYSDGRRPDSVEFVRDVETDLARRDFTINAMAYNRRLTDPFGGMRDIRARLIRCVGDADARFREDALRVMRALRLASELGFAIEQKTSDALRRNAPLVRNIAVERTAAELGNLLLGKNAYDVMAEYGDALSEAIPSFPEKPPEAIKNAPSDLTTRLALLLEPLGEGGARELLQYLKYPRSVVREAPRRVSRGDAYGVLPKPGDLKLRGGDLLALGLRGWAIGETQRALLALVVKGELPNEREALLRAAAGLVIK